MGTSDKEKQMDINEFAKALKELTPRQFEVIKNLTNALYDVQEEIIKVKNC